MAILGGSLSITAEHSQLPFPLLAASFLLPEHPRSRSKLLHLKSQLSSAAARGVAAGGQQRPVLEPGHRRAVPAQGVRIPPWLLAQELHGEGFPSRAAPAHHPAAPRGSSHFGSRRTTPACSPNPAISQSGLLFGSHLSAADCRS